MPALSTGKVAPPFELADLEGKKHLLGEALGRAPVVAAFFKVSCPTCQFTFPFLERLYRQFRDRNVQIWGISQDNAKDSQRFAKEFGVTFPILIDGDHYAVSRNYGLTYVPSIFLITSDGQIQMLSEGFCKGELIELQKALAQHFSATPPPLFPPTERVPEFKPG